MTTTMEQRNLARKLALDHGVELGERGIAMVASLIGDVARLTKTQEAWRAMPDLSSTNNHVKVPRRAFESFGALLMGDAEEADWQSLRHQFDAAIAARATARADLAATVRERDEAREALAGATEALDELGVMQEGSPLLASWRKWVALAHPGTTDAAPKAEPHVCKCANEPCPVCGGGPSGEWSEGSEVKCDDCGTMLVVDGAQECLGRSWFSLASNPCPECRGKGYMTLDGEVIDDEPCAKCDGDGWRELTIEEARKVAGLGGTTDVLKETT